MADLIEERRRHAEYRRRRDMVRSGHPPAPGKQYCPECHHQVPVLKNGGLYKHNAKTGATVLSSGVFSCRGAMS